jgi:hypothetical protein
MADEGGAAVVSGETSPLARSLLGEVAHAVVRRANVASTVTVLSPFTQLPLTVGMCNASTGTYVPRDRLFES